MPRSVAHALLRGVGRAAEIHPIIQIHQNAFIIAVVKLKAWEGGVQEAQPGGLIHLRENDIIKYHKCAVDEIAQSRDALLSVNEPSRHRKAVSVTIPVHAIPDVHARTQTKEDPFDKSALLRLIPHLWTLPWRKNQIQ